MRFEIIVLAITAFFIYNTYHDGKLTKIFIKNKKYIQMGFFAFLGIMFYLLIKKNPLKFKNILLHANNVVKYMPIDKSSMDMISPILDFTTNAASNNGTSDDGGTEYNFMNGLNQTGQLGQGPGQGQGQLSQEKRILQSGGKGTKRSVSETKKNMYIYAKLEMRGMSESIECMVRS